MKVIFLFALLSLSTALHSQLWQQIGADFNGLAALDRQGSAISLSKDGKTLAMGCPANDAAGTDAGTTRVFLWNGSSWQQKGLNIDGEAAGDESGSSISLSADGNTVAIGAYKNQGMGLYAGHVRVYSWNGSAWQQKGIDIDADTANSYTGWRVSLSDDGNTLAVADVIADSSRGHVRVFGWTGSAWQQKGQDIIGEAVTDQLGSSLVLNADGNTLAVGAVNNDSTGYNAGHARVYSWNGVSWQQKGIDINGTAANNYSGNAVSLSDDGNILAIGAFRNSNVANQAGQIRIYEWNGSSWQQKGNDLYGQAADDSFGYSVELSSDGNTLIGGSIYSNATTQDAGQARVFQWNGNSWQQKGEDINGEAFADYLGQSVSIDSTGNTIAIAAPYNDSNGPAAGKVRVYSCNRNAAATVSVCDSYTSPSGNYTWTVNGTYMDTISSVSGCDSLITINLTVNASPAVNFNLTTDTVCLSDAAFTITGTSPSGGVFAGTGVNGNTFNPALATPGNHVISYTFTDANGCTGTMNDSVFVDICAGIGLSGEVNTSLAIFPNPSAGGFTVNTNVIADQIEIFDVLGNKIISIAPSSTTVNFNLDSQPNGTYFVRVHSGDSQSMSRVLLTR